MKRKGKTVFIDYNPSDSWLLDLAKSLGGGSPNVVIMHPIDWYNLEMGKAKSERGFIRLPRKYKKTLTNHKLT